MTPRDRWLADLTAGSDEQAEAAAQALAAFGESALPDLRALLAAPDPDARWWALRTLALIPAPEAASLLRGALGDPDAEVRAAAIVALGRRGAAAEAILPLLSDPSAYLARLASDALVRIGSPAVPGLLGALRSEDPQTRANAARALALIAAPDAIPALVAALEDESVIVQHWAEEGLERLGVGTVYFRP